MGTLLVSVHEPISGHTDSKYMTIDLVQIRALRVAVAVADQGSFAAAGRHLNLPRAAISRIVGQFEERSGTRVFRRNTRKVVATEAGEVLIDAARRALVEIDAALEPTEMGDADLSGQVRMSVSHAFGRYFVLPSIGYFREQHPGVQIETLLQDRLDDMIEEDIDFTIRLGPLPESDLIVRRLGAICSSLFAAPSFLRALETPVGANTLDRVPAVGFRIPGTGRVMTWPVQVDGCNFHSIVPRSVVSSDSIEAVLDLAKEGHGVALLPRYLAGTDVASERLEPVIPDQISVLTDVHICFRERRFMPRRVRILIDHLASEITRDLRAFL